MSRAKIKLSIGPGGVVTINTIENAGPKCRQLADQLGAVFGPADETTRGDTADLHKTIESEQDHTQDLETDGSG